MKKPSRTTDRPGESKFTILKADGIFIGIILLLSLAVYSNSLFNGFVYDDALQVLENPWIKDIKNIPEIFTSNAWSFKGKAVVSNYYRPLMHVMYMFAYHIFGLNPWGFHLINILFHAGISVLVFIITKRLLIGSSHSPDASFPAFMASLLFATHPIHTEAVAWIAAIPELSYTFFTLLSFYLYMKSKEGVKKTYLFSVLSFVLATVCKEPALTLPVILIAYDHVFRKDGDRFPDRIKRYSPYIIASVCYLLMRSYALRGFLPRELNVTLSGYEFFINVFPLFSKYLEKLLLPINLNAFHEFHPISSLFQLKGIMSFAISAAFVVFSVIAMKKNKIVFLSSMLIALPLLPALYLPALGANVFTERYLYLPSFGFVLLIAFVLSWAKLQQSKLSVSLKIIVILLIGIYSAGTISRNAVWRDCYTLYSDILKKSPGAVVIHYNLGVVNAEQGRLDEALNEYQIVLNLKPNHSKVHNNLGAIYAEQGRVNEAINEYQTELRLNPYNAETHHNLGVAYLDQGRTDEAIREFKSALKINPNLPMSRQFLEYLLKNK